MGIRQEKASLRKRLQARVGAMDADRKVEASKKACEHLIQSPFFKKAKGVMIFWPLPDEADPRGLAVSALAQAKEVALPSVQGDALRPLRLRSLTEPMRLGSKGVQVPQKQQSMAPEDLDLVIVPGVGFDFLGRRLGRGGGYYDRYLVALGQSTRCIGFGFAEQLVSEVPIEPHDALLDGVVTDLGLQVIDRSQQNQDSA